MEPRRRLTQSTTPSRPRTVRRSRGTIRSIPTSGIRSRRAARNRLAADRPGFELWLITVLGGLLAGGGVILLGYGALSWRSIRSIPSPQSKLRLLAAATDEQPARADHPRDQTSYSCRRRIPGRSLGPDASGGQAPAHRLNQVGTTALHGDGEFAKSNSRGGSGLKTGPSHRYRKSERSVALSLPSVWPSICLWPKSALTSNYLRQLAARRSRW
jgi:hypothetical protein